MGMSDKKTPRKWAGGGDGPQEEMVRGEYHGFRIAQNHGFR
ncbi:hypothetical protein RUM8411_03207 [Ruegeria meonggei]|uniref:Uncharacterized protein n=1 Tax=Ruegeria meonggei TaxID=1446476 RepID=A0A1X6ZX80_9RHOB|nr:hypothetical protein RUM8411_03207 [Ruegeria meonggei]